MVTTAASVEWTVVATEVEALQLEYSWIKEFDPRFNVKYRDDKSYPSLAVTLHEEYPRLQVMRGPKKKGVRYFGPYSHAWAIRETLDLLLRVFPARTCSAGVFKRPGPPRTPPPGAGGGPPPGPAPPASPRGPAGPARPACSGTSASAPPPASAGCRPRSTARSSTTSATSWPAPRPPSSVGSSSR